MGETNLLVADGDCKCPIIWQCSHGKSLRPATASDIPVKLIDPAKAAEALGLSAWDFRSTANVWMGHDEAKRWEEAARRVREAQEAETGGTT